MATEDKTEWWETIFSTLQDLDGIWDGSGPDSWVDDLEYLVLIREEVQKRIKQVKGLLSKREVV